MSEDHFLRSISRDTNVEVSALSPKVVNKNGEGVGSLARRLDVDIQSACKRKGLLS